MSEMTKTHDADDTFMRIIGTIKLITHDRRIMELVNFSMFEWLGVPAIPWCDLCDQFRNSVYSKTYFEKLVDTWTVHLVRRYGKQRSATTTNSEFVWIPKRKSRVCSKIWTTERVRRLPFGQYMTTVRTEWEGLILVAFKTPTEKRFECNAVCKVPDVIRSVAFHITITKLFWTKYNDLQNQILAMAEESPNMLMATNKTTLNMLGIAGTAKQNILKGLKAVVIFAKKKARLAQFRQAQIQYRRQFDVWHQRFVDSIPQGDSVFDESTLAAQRHKLDLVTGGPFPSCSYNYTQSQYSAPTIWSKTFLVVMLQKEWVHEQILVQNLCTLLMTIPVFWIYPLTVIPAPSLLTDPLLRRGVQAALLQIFTYRLCYCMMQNTKVPCTAQKF